MTAIEKEIEKLHQQASDISDMKEDIFNVKSDITITAVGVLLKKLDDGINDMLEVAINKDYFDAKLGDTLKSIINEAVQAIAKIKIEAPEVKVSPTFSVDLKPMQNIAEGIGKQNDVIISLMQKLAQGDNGRGEQLQKLITVMVDKNNAFLDKVFTQADYSKELKGIGDAVNKRPSQWEANVKRNQIGQLETVIIKTTK